MNKEGDVLQSLESIISLICQVTTSMEQGVLSCNSNDRARIRFLWDTVLKISSHVSAQSKERRDSILFKVLLKIINKRMLDIETVLKKIQDGKLWFTANFDMLEMVMRGHLEELVALFPNGYETPCPIDIIEDEDAATLWVYQFGVDTYYVEFDTIVQKLGDMGFITSTKKMTPYLRYFLDFPGDNIVTIFKWNQLIRLFGPLMQFNANFELVTMGMGFMGMTNRIHAHELLRGMPGEKLFLTRMSRTEPSFFAFSYKNSQGMICHRVNKNTNGDIVPIMEFIQKTFPTYSCVNKKLDIESLTNHRSGFITLIDYISEDRGYIVGDDNDDIE